MSQKFSIAFDQPTGGHPHDLLARLYREIGISAVAAALEVTGMPEAEARAEKKQEKIPAILLGEDLAA